MIPHKKLAIKANFTPLLENNLLKGASKPFLTSVILRKYDPKTIIKIPINFCEVGISWRVNMAIKVTKTGVNELIGARSEMGDNLIAQSDKRNATRSKIAEVNIKIRNLFET